VRVDIVKTSETGKTNNIDRDAAGDVMGLLAMLSLCNRDDPYSDLSAAGFRAT